MERRPRRKGNNQEKALGWEWGYVRPGRGLGAERSMGVGNVRGKAHVRELQSTSSWGRREPWAKLEQGSDLARPE